ncbi:MAG: hypothetical protein VYA84_19685 [Planctomycetota bacterium]|nr:hypothetical protein [Planctomycetota bacterium]
MSVRKLTASLLTALAMLSGATMAHSQEYVPVADPFAFDPDFRWFEPVYNMDLAEMKPKKRAATGWFATYDRLSLYGSRPEVDEPGSSEYLLDEGWGHRYEIGFMLPGEDNGWMLNWTQNGVSDAFVLRQERLNRFIDPSEGFSPVAPPFGVAVRQIEDNNPGYNFRFYDVGDSNNIVKYDSYELNKTWRLEPYHYGGILEPMVGLRWMRINDYNYFDTYLNTESNPPLAGPNFEDAEQFDRAYAATDNEMFGGQLGFRYFKFRDRFIFSSDFRAFFGGSWQNSVSAVASELTIYGGSDVGATVERILVSSTEPINTRNEEFFFGFDVRGEIGYQLTKMISIRGGFQVIDVARGVWRGGEGIVVDGGDNDQDLLLVGATFGINLNH